MSSTVFYKFVHQKHQSTIHFDGTGINVFDLKHEIIKQNQLGEGNDFNLKLYHLEQPDLEYDQDQDVIPRSSFVIAKRVPANVKVGKFGNASRYVSGKPRINRKAINASNNQTGATAPVAQQPVDENMTEEDKIKMMFENQSNVWAQTQDELAQHKMIYSKPTAAANPEDAPPPGYVCYRCGGRDHWIKNCPTNTDPNFEGKKLRKTTGIPRSYLKTVSKEAIEESELSANADGELVDNQGNRYMITETGEYVIAMTDTKTWLNYQEKQQNAVMKAKKEFEDKIIEQMVKDGKVEFLNPLAHPTKKILVPPIVMTPCCQDKTKLQKMTNFNYNKDQLEQLLIGNDFHCPNCDSDDVFIDNLVKNEELEQELKEYIENKTKELGLEDPNESLGLKRQNEEGEENDAKRQNVDMSQWKPGQPMPAFPMPFMGGMPPFPMMMPMMPPPKK